MAFTAEERRIRNLTQRRVEFSPQVPSRDQMEDGERQYAREQGKNLRQYVRIGSQLYYSEFLPVNKPLPKDEKVTTLSDVNITGNLDVDGTTNLDNTDIDGTLVVDGSNISLDSTATLNIDNSNTSNGITIGTATSGVPVSIGHTTSETTVNDNLVVTGDADLNGALDVSGTSNLDVVDIDGAVDMASTLALGDAMSVQDAAINITVNSADTAGSILNFYKSRHATDGSHTDLADNDYIGAINFYGSQGSAYRSAAKIESRVTNTVSSDMPTSLIFSTCSSGSTSATERLRIDHSGQLSMTNSAHCAIIQNTTHASEWAGIQFERSGTRQWTTYLQAANYKIADIGYNGGMYMGQDDTSWTGNSDERMKRDIVELTNATAKLNTLRCVNYNYNLDAEDRDPRIGLIAQDVYKVYPEATTGSPDDEYEYVPSVNGSPAEHKNAMGLSLEQLVPAIIKAIQELSAEVDKLKE